MHWHRRVVPAGARQRVAVPAVVVGPVMRVTTLKASAEKLSGLLDYYAGLAEDQARPGPGRGPVDYYLDPDEPPGRWWGNGRHALGLDGTVTGDDLRAVLEGRHPRLRCAPRSGVR